MIQDRFKNDEPASPQTPKSITSKNPRFSVQFVENGTNTLLQAPSASKFRIDKLLEEKNSIVSPIDVRRSSQMSNKSDEFLFDTSRILTSQFKQDKLVSRINKNTERTKGSEEAPKRDFLLSSLEKVVRFKKSVSDFSQPESQVDSQHENQPESNNANEDKNKAKKPKKSIKSRLSKTETQRLQYFGVDNDQDPLRIRESDIIFKYRQFFEFLFYHLVFFFGLGPLSFIILYPTAGIILTKNMGFSGINTMFINQSIQWGLLFSSVFLWVFTDHGDVGSVEVYMIASAVFLRICTISSKYGSMHPLRIKVLKSRYLTYEELTQDYMLLKWRDQTDDIIEQELLAAVKRHDVDTSLFFLNFLADIDENTRKKLDSRKGTVVETTKKIIAQEFLKAQTMETQKLEALKTTKKEEDEVGDADEQEGGGIEFKLYNFIPSQVPPGVATEPDVQSDESINESKHSAPIVRKLSTMRQKPPVAPAKKQNLLSATLKNIHLFDMFSGINLAREIIFEAKKRSIPRILQFALGIGLLRGIIPLLYRIATGKEAAGHTGVQIYMAVSYIICNMYFFGANLAFVLVGLSDLQKKFYLMTQLSNLLSARKLEQYESIKIYPTINIFDPISLRCWINLRKIFMDFGRKYFLRINLNISIFLFFYFIILVILLLKFFGIMTIIQDDLLSFVFLFEVLLMFGLMIRSIIMGAWINDHFRVHKSILQKNKTVVSDLLQLDDIYFPVVQNDFRPANILYQEGVRKIRSLVRLAGLDEGSQEAARAIEDYLGKLVEFNDNAIEELDFDAENNPVKILGFVTNNELVSQIFAGLFSIGVAMVQKIVEKDTKTVDTTTSLNDAATSGTFTRTGLI